MISDLKQASEARFLANVQAAILADPTLNKAAGFVDALIEFQRANPTATTVNTPNLPKVPLPVVQAFTQNWGYEFTTTPTTAPTGWTGYSTSWVFINSISWAGMVIGEEKKVILKTDTPNANAVANTLIDSGLEFSVTSGLSYHFHAFIPYTAQATTTGSRWVLDGPASVLTLQSVYTLTAIAQTVNYVAGYNLPAACNASSLSINNAQLRGSITANANGTVKIRFASEVANSAITAKAGAILTYTRIL